MKHILITLLGLLAIGCNVNYPKYQDYPKKRNIIDLDKAKKLEPNEVQHLFIQEYIDTIFPNDDILRYKNLKSLFVAGRRAKKSRKDTITLPPLKIQIDTSKIDELNNLTLLEMSYFDFSIFPVEILKFTKLEFLVLGASSIKNVPPKIKQLKNLEHLSFRLNNLTTLPENISYLSSLKAIDLSNNNLSHIPDVLLKMDSLKFISLANLETKTQLKNGVWNWPYPMYINQIDYHKSLGKLERLANKGNTIIYIHTDNALEKKRLKSKMSEKLKKSIKIKLKE